MSSRSLIRIELDAMNLVAHSGLVFTVLRIN